jgi:hypothetical protein
MQASEAGSAVSNSADAATAARSLDAAEPLQTRGRPELGNASSGKKGRAGRCTWRRRKGKLPIASGLKPPNGYVQPVGGFFVGPCLEERDDPVQEGSKWPQLTR